MLIYAASVFKEIRFSIFLQNVYMLDLPKPPGSVIKLNVCISILVFKYFGQKHHRYIDCRNAHLHLISTIYVIIPKIQLLIVVILFSSSCLLFCFTTSHHSHQNTITHSAVISTVSLIIYLTETGITCQKKD